MIRIGLSMGNRQKVLDVHIDYACHLLLLLFLLSPVDLLRAAPAPPDVREIVQHYKESIAWKSMVSMEMKVRTDVIIKQENRESITRRSLDVIYRRDGNRVEYIGSNVLLNPDNSVNPEGSLELAEVINGELYFHGDRYYRLKRHSGYIKRDFSNEQKSMLSSVARGLFLEGCIGGVGEYKDMAEMLCGSESLHLIGEEDVNGRLCYVIKAATTYGMFTVWIAPDEDYNVLRYVVNKSANNILRDNITVDNDGVKEWTLVVDHIKLEQINGRRVPIGGSLTNSIRYKDGTERTVNVTAERKEIDLNPDFEAQDAFALNLPDGTVVNDYDFRGVKYQIFKGRLVPMVDRHAVDVIEQEVKQLRTEKGAFGLRSESMDISHDGLIVEPEAGPQEIVPKDSKQQQETISQAGGFWGPMLFAVIMLVVGAALVLLVRRKRGSNVQC
jgi:hypothetical protein